MPVLQEHRANNSEVGKQWYKEAAAHRREIATLNHSVASLRGSVVAVLVSVLSFFALLFALFCPLSSVGGNFHFAPSRQLEESAGMLDACNQAFVLLGSEVEDLKRANAVSLVCIPETLFCKYEDLVSMH
jgi:hypothetical protein